MEGGAGQQGRENMVGARLGRAEVGVREGEASTSGCWRVGRPRAQLSWERPKHEGQLSSPLSLHAQSGPAQRAPDTGLLKVQWEELGRGLRRNWLGEEGVRMGVLWTRVSKRNFAWSPEVGRGRNALALGLRIRMGSVHLDGSTLLTRNLLLCVLLWVAGAGTLWHT